MTRDQLSQLLLVYIGMAADMLEYSSETLRVNEIACSRTIFIGIMVVWSWSLMQFCLGLTATSGRKSRAVANAQEENDEVSSVTLSASLESTANLKTGLIYSGLCSTELWAVLISLFVQDGPFLITRLYIMFYFKVYERSMIFFTCKNGLLLFLMFYRLRAVIMKAKKTQRIQMERLREHIANKTLGVGPHDDEDNDALGNNHSRNSIDSNVFHVVVISGNEREDALTRVYVSHQQPAVTDQTVGAGDSRMHHISADSGKDNASYIDSNEKYYNDNQSDYDNEQINEKHPMGTSAVPVYQHVC